LQHGTLTRGIAGMPVGSGFEGAAAQEGAVLTRHMTNGPARTRAEVAAAVDEMVGSGAETGLQVCVIKDGHTVVDVVGGLADVAAGAAVMGDTLFFAASTAKGVAASLAHALAERDELDYDLRLADVWPEFGSHGKETITVRHVLLHTAGVPGLPPGTTVEDLCDWDRMCSALAAAQPWWEPGTRIGYHAKTFGFLLGEALRRVTGRSIPDLLREVLTGPLGIEDEIHFGVPRRLLPRVARQVPGDTEVPLPPPGSALDRAMPPGVFPDAGYANRVDVLTAVLPSEGTMTARGAARLYAAMLGHAEGVSLVSPRRLAEIASIAFTGTDEVMGIPTEWAFGYSPYRPGGVAARPGSTFGMIGMNGSAAYADIESGVAVAVMRNRFAAGDMTVVERIGRIVAETLS
jgi:CubicO group peptidase (beta-lactamase class C family)